MQESRSGESIPEKPRLQIDTVEESSFDYDDEDDKGSHGLLADTGSPFAEDLDEPKKSNSEPKPTLQERLTQVRADLAQTYERLEAEDPDDRYNDIEELQQDERDLMAEENEIELALFQQEHNGLTPEEVEDQAKRDAEDQEAIDADAAQHHAENPGSIYIA